jgi:L-aminopeptidase/D-esterase-like protein
VGGVDVRGSATGSVELDVLNPGHVAPHVDAIVLAGGSAFGLEAAAGVRRALEKRGVGFDTGVGRVPIVPGAILFDLAIGKPGVRPDREMGEKAVAAASQAAVGEGNVGAGTGATIGKLFGIKQSMKGGVGSASLTLGSGVMVGAMVVVNALGDVIDPETGKIVAGARKSADSREFVNSAAAMRHGVSGPAFRGNTTLAVIATNARLDRVQTTKVAALASVGVARTISPVNTMSDGDMTFALSAGKEEASVDAVGAAAAEALATAVLRAVRAAKTLGGVPGLG